MNLKFTKLHGAGNDYFYIDAINDLPVCLREDTDFYEKLSLKISDRHFGVGSDGVIVILPPSREAVEAGADFQMRMFNADGSEGEMCGNGIRCFAKYVYDRHLTDKKSITIDTLAGIKTVDVSLFGGVVREAKVFMGRPVFEAGLVPAVYGKPEIINEKLAAGDREFEVSCVSMGNPHCVIFVDDVKNMDVQRYGSIIENHSMFPKRINVEFVEVLGENDVLVRTWERGSGETLACGTGACAVYSVMKKTGKVSGGLNVNLYGGKLKISGELSGGIYMVGPAEEVFTGYFNIDYNPGR